MVQNPPETRQGTGLFVHHFAKEAWRDYAVEDATRLAEYTHDAEDRSPMLRYRCDGCGIALIAPQHFRRVLDPRDRACECPRKPCPDAARLRGLVSTRAKCPDCGNVFGHTCRI